MFKFNIWTYCLRSSQNGPGGWSAVGTISIHKYHSPCCVCAMDWDCDACWLSIDHINILLWVHVRPRDKWFKLIISGLYIQGKKWQSHCNEKRSPFSNCSNSTIDSFYYIHLHTLFEIEQECCYWPLTNSFSFMMNNGSDRGRNCRSQYDDITMVGRVLLLKVVSWWSVLVAFTRQPDDVLLPLNNSLFAGNSCAPVHFK